MKELAKQYDPSQVEDRIYQFWQDGGYFHTEADMLFATLDPTSRKLIPVSYTHLVWK